MAATEARAGDHIGELTGQCALGGVEVAVLDMIERGPGLTGQATGDLLAMQIGNR